MAAIVWSLVSAPTAVADDGMHLIECPNHTHIYGKTIADCQDRAPFGFPGTGGKGQSGGGLLGTIGRALGGLL